MVDVKGGDMNQDFAETLSELLGCKHPVEAQVSCILDGESGVSCLQCGAKRSLEGTNDGKWFGPAFVEMLAAASTQEGSTCNQCGKRVEGDPCAVFDRDNGEVSGVAVVCLPCLRVALWELEDRCVYCGQPFTDGVRVGAGDGSGKRFVHRACYTRGWSPSRFG
jgi:hypothetical protein